MAPDAARHWVVPFAEADASAVDLLGGKGAGLARMAGDGLPVPYGFIVTTDACRYFLERNRAPDALHEQIAGELRALEERTRRRFGGGPHPLLVSVRSGAPVSMPGMMDTILNLGLNREAATALAELTGDVRFVADTTVRFHRMFSEVVLGAAPEGIDAAASDLLGGLEDEADAGGVFDRLWGLCQDAVAADVDRVVPPEPINQLVAAVEAVFRSWNSRRAKVYRDHHHIPHDLGTAVVVQMMVFGNLGEPSGTGVAFTRNPIDGTGALYGEYLAGGQGEDVVSGTVDPEPIADAARRLPVVFDELERLSRQLEREYADALDIEYTIEQGALYFLQVRVAKRTPQAAVRIAAELAESGAISWHEALRRVEVEHVRSLEQVRFDEAALAEARTNGALLAAGVGASPGQVSGVLVLDPQRAVERAARGELVILARPTTSPRDLHGMIAAAGILTARGGATSHAAVVARALAKACVVGCAELAISEDTGRLHSGERVLEEGAQLSLDGATGEIYAGALPMNRPSASSPHLVRLLRTADEAVDADVLARATTVAQIDEALARGAHGIVTSVDDVLATNGELDRAITAVTDQIELDDWDLSELSDLLANQFTPLLERAGRAPVHVRAIDFLADEARELLRQTELLASHPLLSVPLGIPELVAAQLRGLRTAIAVSGYEGRACLAVRHITDPQEARALRAIAGSETPAVDLAAYITSPRGALLAAELAEECDLLWVEVRVLQAMVFGFPPRQFLTSEPMTTYRRRGMISVDPREDIDRSMDVFLDAAGAAVANGHRVGMRLSGPVHEGVARTLVGRGFRLFGVDGGEIGAVRLALGRAALPEGDDQ